MCKAKDIAQLEQRILAQINGEEPNDLYALHASDMFHVPLDQVTPAQRRAAKADAFRRMYSVPFHSSSIGVKHDRS